MLSLREFQSSFGAAVRHTSSVEAGLLHEIVRDGGIPVERRLDVYRNNIHASLIDALESAFPVITRLVGGEFFRAMGREFLCSHMPVQGTLVGFGAAMPEFLDGFEPVSALPYLGDVARLELAWLSSYHGVSDIPVGADELAAIPPEEMVDLHFDLHPTVQTVSSAFPVWSIWRANRELENPGKVDLASGGETVLLLRPDLTVETHNVSQEVVIFVEAIRQRRSLGEASEAALQTSRDFDLALALHLLLTGGAFGHIHRSVTEEQ